MIKIQNISRIAKIAKDNGGKLLSKKYFGTKHKLKFSCKNGHVFKANVKNVLYNKSWCPNCSHPNKNKLSMKDVSDRLYNKGITYISGEYNDIYSRLNVKCKANHLFNLSIGELSRRKYPCSLCKNNFKKMHGPQYKLSLNTFIKIARKKGGDCISKKYRGIKEKLEFKCKYGHTWLARPNDIRNKNSWCPKCSNRASITKYDFINLLLELDYICLNIDDFKYSKTLLNIQCNNGHIWKAHYNRIYNGSRCPHCTNNAPLTIDLLAEFARKEHDGQLLSSIYIDNKKKLKWQCKDGHIFLMSAHSAKNAKQWCPECSENKTEKECRKILNELFNCSFLKIRPQWLIGSKGRPLELDGYCSELNMAFEYNGPQHYMFINQMHGGKFNNFLKQKERDKIKLKKCQKLGIKLIIIPYIKSWDKKTLKEYLLKIIKNYGYELPKQNN